MDLYCNPYAVGTDCFGGIVKSVAFPNRNGTGVLFDGSNACGKFTTYTGRKGWRGHRVIVQRDYGDYGVMLFFHNLAHVCYVLE